ncbi:MAG: hypothetical protein ACR2HP_03105 [Ilumatobacteraceae bacterium]
MSHDEAHKLLTIYLGDHLGGSSAGLALVRRCRRSNAGTDLDRVLAQIESQVEADIRSLEELMVRLEVAPSRLKKAGARLAELAARLKSNGRIFTYSPLSRVLELEGLTSGIGAKRSLWQSLLAVADQHPELDAGELRILVDQASSQYERVSIERDRAAASAFGTRTA